MFGEFISFCFGAEKESASLHGCHSNVNCYFKYLNILKVFLMLG